MHCYKCGRIFNMHYRAVCWYVRRLFFFLMMWRKIFKTTQILKRLHSLIFAQKRKTEWLLVQLSARCSGASWSFWLCGSLLTLWRSTNTTGSKNQRPMRWSKVLLHFTMSFQLPFLQSVWHQLSATRRSSPQAQEAPDSVTLATPAGNLHAERDEPQA